MSKPVITLTSDFGDDFAKDQVVHIDSYGNIKLSSKPNGFKVGEKLKITT